MEFSYNNQYQTRTSSYHSSQTFSFDPENSCVRLQSSPENENNPWKVTKGDELLYRKTDQQSPLECSMAAHRQESVRLTYKNLEYMKLESEKEKLDRFHRWLKQSANAPPPPFTDMVPPSNDWNRNKLTPKLRVAPPRSTAWDEGPKLNYLWNNEINEIPVPVRSPAWCDSIRQSAGQKRKWDQEEECIQSNGQTTSWQSMKRFVTEDRRIQTPYEEDNCPRFTRYEESVYETRIRRTICLTSSEDYGTYSTEAKRQARVDRFQMDLDFLNIKNPVQDRLNCSLDEIIKSERITSPKKIRDMPGHSRMYGSVPPSPLPSSSHSKFEMKPYEYSNTRRERERRPIVIDGSNVAYGKSLGKYFDSNGICICVDWFLKRGYTDIVVVVPEHRLNYSGCLNPEPLRKLQRENKLVTCWSRKLPNGRWVSSYDDRMIVEIAHRRGGVIVSNDKFRDLQKERPDWAETIGTRVLGFRFMPGKMDEIMFPKDPFGRYGPMLEELLRF